MGDPVEVVVVASVGAAVVVSVVEGAGREGEEHPEERPEGEGGEAKVEGEGEENLWLNNREVPDSMTSVWPKRSMLSLSRYAPFLLCIGPNKSANPRAMRGVSRRMSPISWMWTRMRRTRRRTSSRPSLT